MKWITGVNVITINGQRFETLSGNIDVVGRRVMIDGKEIDVGAVSDTIEVHVIEGSIGHLRADGSVRCNDVIGTVNAGGSIKCGNVSGTVNAGGSITCGNVGGQIRAGGSVSVKGRQV